MKHKIELSTRMKMNAGLVPDGSSVADIGCDHGYVSIFLAKEKRCPKVIALDVNAGPLAIAKENIAQAGLQDQVECRLSDGMEALSPGEVDTLLLAGMGGQLICRILQQSQTVLCGITTLVIQAQSDLREVRKTLHRLGFWIEEEQFCRDGDKNYIAIRALRGEEASPYTEEEYQYGRILPAGQEECYHQYLLTELNKRKKIIKELRHHHTEKAISRIFGMRQEIQEIQKLFEKYYGGNMAQITWKNKEITCEEGMTLYELSRKLQPEYEFPIIVAKVDGVIQELYHEVTDGTTVSFCTTQDNDGKRAYIRGMSMLLLKAVEDEIPPEEREAVSIDFCLDSGYFCRIVGSAKLDEDLLFRLEARMRQYVKEDIRFEKCVIRTRDAKQIFDRLHMPDKSTLMEYRRNSRMTVYYLGDFMDYYYGAMPYSTSILSYFRLELFEDGFVFVVPKKEAPTTMPAFSPSMKQYHTMKMADEWCAKMQVSTVGELNEAIVKGRLQELMLTQEALHEKTIADIAVEIARRGCRIVTIAGPSSSGKTTFSYRLSTQLRTLGLHPYPIALDDYFVNREDTPKDENGKYDYECLEAIDTRQFNEDLMALLEGQPVRLPTYNFITGLREYDKPLLKLGQEDLLVIEGIHGLNDKLTYRIPKNDKFKIYISALTTLNLDNHNRIPTTEGRLLRRIIRDARTRGNSARKTISMWNSVRRGESRNIFPFQEEADAMFNSALIYELAAMKLYADPLLFQVTKDCPEYAEAQRLLKFLDYFLPIDPHDVPLNSILREFIGGGILLA